MKKLYLLFRNITYLLFFVFLYYFILMISYDNYNVCIITIAVNIKCEDSFMFINSLTKTHYSGKLIIFSDKQIKYKEGGLFKVHIIRISLSWPFINNDSVLFSKLNECMLPSHIKKYKWAIYRYSLYYCYLKMFSYLYSNIFLLDIRDTLFQKNPQHIKIKKSIYFCEDARYPFKISDDKYNNMWLLPLCKRNDTIFNNVPLNGGTIYGFKNNILVFLTMFIEYIKNYYNITSDQGIINLLYYKNKITNINIIINRNNEDPVYNMGIEYKYKYHFSNTCYNIYNNVIYRNNFSNIPYIVHQYDRDKKIRINMLKYYV